MTTVARLREAERRAGAWGIDLDWGRALGDEFALVEVQQADDDGSRRPDGASWETIAVLLPGTSRLMVPTNPDERFHFRAREIRDGYSDSDWVGPVDALSVPLNDIEPPPAPADGDTNPQNLLGKDALAEHTVTGGSNFSYQFLGFRASHDGGSLSELGWSAGRVFSFGAELRTTAPGTDAWRMIAVFKDSAGSQVGSTVATAQADSDTYTEYAAVGEVPASAASVEFRATSSASPTGTRKVRRAWVVAGRRRTARVAAPFKVGTDDLAGGVDQLSERGSLPLATQVGAAGSEYPVFSRFESHLAQDGDALTFSPSFDKTPAWGWMFAPGASRVFSSGDSASDQHVRVALSGLDADGVDDVIAELVVSTDTVATVTEGWATTQGGTEGENSVTVEGDELFCRLSHTSLGDTRFRPGLVLDTQSLEATNRVVTVHIEKENGGAWDPVWDRPYKAGGTYTINPEFVTDLGTDDDFRAYYSGDEALPDGAVTLTGNAAGGSPPGMEYDRVTSAATARTLTPNAAHKIRIFLGEA